MRGPVRLWLRFAAAMAVVSLVPLILSMVLTTRVSAAKAERLGEELRARDAAAFSTFVATWMQDQAAAVGGWMQLYPLGTQSDAQRTGLLRAVHRAVPAVVVVALVDGDRRPLVPPVFLSEETEEADPLNGRAIASSEEAAHLITVLPVREALEQPGVAAVGTPYEPAGAGRTVVPVAVAGPYGEGIVLGAEVDLGLLVDVAAARSSGGRGVALLDVQGRAFVGGNHPLVDPAVVAGLLGNTASVAYQTRQQPVRGALTPVGNLDWSVLVAEPSAVAARGANEIRRRSLEALVLAVLLALVAALVLARTLSEPIADLTDSALAVAEGDLGRVVRTQGGDEIGQLSSAFNLMSRRIAENRDQIMAQRDEIEAFNRELQKRVEDRTRKLERAQEALVASGQLAAVAEIGAGLAHELNNPLAGVLGIAQVLRARSDDPLLAQLVEQAERCRVVAEEMTRLATPEGAGQTSVIDLAKVLEEVLPPIRATARQRGVTVSLDPIPEHLEVRADPALAGKALVQLLLAITAGLGTGGAVVIRASESGDLVCVEMTPDRPVDEGAHRDNFLAAGVSLWVARQLVARLGGRVVSPGDDPSWLIQLPGVR